MARIVVAGGAGFIGSHLCDALLARGEQVVVLDNLLTGRLVNIEHLLVHPEFTLLEHDVTVAPPLSGAVDAVVNLASPASPTAYAAHPVETLDVGSLGTRNLLDLATCAGARFLQASTSEVYGDPAVHPQPESYWGNVNPIGPRSCYDEAKRFGEALVVAYSGTRGTNTAVARIFNTYGERMRADDGRVVTNFIVQALRGEPISMYGDGEQTRSFCYVTDEVRGLLALLDSDLPGPVNIGNPHEISMRTLAEAILDITNSPSDLVSVPLPAEREGDPARRQPDITLARTELGWEPTTPLEVGLARTIAWLGAELDGLDPRVALSGIDDPLRVATRR